MDLGRLARVRRLGIAFLALLGLIPLLWLDPYTIKIHEAVPRWSWLRSVIEPLRDFGTFFTQVVILALAIALDPGRRRWALAGLVAVSIAFLSVHAVKALSGRMRPETHAGAFTWTAPWPPARLLDDRRKSFPSGHSASAFALAAVLARAYRRGRWGFYLLAAGCAASRVIDARHHPTDVYAGALIGIAVACCLTARLSRSCPPPATAS